MIQWAGHDAPRHGLAVALGFTLDLTRKLFEQRVASDGTRGERPFWSIPAQTRALPARHRETSDFALSQQGLTSGQCVTSDRPIAQFNQDWRLRSRLIFTLLLDAPQPLQYGEIQLFEITLKSSRLGTRKLIQTRKKMRLARRGKRFGIK